MAAPVHIVFTSECNNTQFDWFAVGVFESFRASGFHGNITRLLACSAEARTHTRTRTRTRTHAHAHARTHARTLAHTRTSLRRTLSWGPKALASYKGMSIGEGVGRTFVHPNYRHNPLNGDVSASYNKPASVMHWSSEADFTEEFVLFIDADMLLLKPIDPVAMGAKRGTVVSERVSYMIGTSNKLAAQFLPPEAVPKAKPVGWYHIFHRDDLRQIAPRWLHYCGRVRTEPRRYWRLNGTGEDIPTGRRFPAQHGRRPHHESVPYLFRRRICAARPGAVDRDVLRVSDMSTTCPSPVSQAPWIAVRRVSDMSTTCPSPVSQAPWIAEMYGYAFGARSDADTRSDALDTFRGSECRPTSPRLAPRGKCLPARSSPL